MRIVEVVSRGKIFVGFEILGLERLGNFILFVKPFAEINKFASFGTKWTVRRFKPFS
jgi:hypothetical protein